MTITDQDDLMGTAATGDTSETSVETQNEAEAVDAATDDELDDADEESIDPNEALKAVKAELQATKEKYLRSLADMDNLRKRSRRDVEEARLNGRINVLEDLLPALDSIDMALKSVTPTSENQGVYDGMVMVQKQFMASMDRFELKAVEAVGKKFDPLLHEAVSYVPSPDHDAGEIIDEMRKGYLLGDRLIRASMVVVSSGKPVQAPHGEKEATEQTGSETDDVSLETDSNELSN